VFFINYLISILRRCKINTLHKIGDFLGTIVYYSSSSRRRVARKNLRIALNNELDEKLVKESFKNSFKSIMEIFFVSNIDEKFIKENMIIENFDLLLEIKKQNEPLFLISGHIGSWEFLPIIYSHITNGEIAVVGKTTRSKKLDKIIYDLRSSNKIHYITHSNAIISIQKYLKKGIPVGALLDQGGLEKNSFFIDLFGQKTTFVNGLPIYAAKIKATIIMAFMIRNFDKWKLVLYPPIKIDQSLEKLETAKKLARQINEVYEDIIKKYPEQWFALNKRFKRVESENGEICSLY